MTSATNKMIYILEDDPDILQMLEFLLKKGGFAVKGFETVKEFNEQLHLQSPDLFILDINLPDGNGLEVCRSISNTTVTSPIPVIMMSANQIYVDDYKAAGGRDFISKPFNIGRIMDVVNKHTSAN